MAKLIGVVGPSGTGKTTSYCPIPEAGIKGLNPAETMVITAVPKDLPFRGWSKHYTEFKGSTGNYLITDKPNRIVRAMEAVSKNRPEIKNIVLDDLQFVMSNEYMARANEKDYKKFVDIGQHMFTIIGKSRELRDDLTIFVLTHSEFGKDGVAKIKTVGNMVDQYVTMDGWFMPLLYTKVLVDGSERKHVFVTKHDGEYPAKSSFGLFDDIYIPNDLGKVKDAILEYAE